MVRGTPHVPILLTSFLFSLALRFGGTIVVARFLGPAAAGVYAAVGTAIEIGDRAFAIGRPESIAYHVSAGGPPGPLLAEALATLRRRLVWSGAAGLTLAVVFLIRHVGWEVALTVALVIASLPVTASAKSCWREVRLATGDSKKVAISEVIRALVAVTFVLVACLAPLGFSLAVAQAVLVLGFGIAEWVVRDYLAISGTAAQFGAVPASFRTFARSAYFASLAQPLNQRADQLVLLILLPVRSVGFYATAVSVSLVVSVIGTGVAQAVYPRLFDSGLSEELAKKNGSRLGLLLLLVTLPLAGATIAFTPFLIDLAFGEEYSPAVTAARVLVLGAVVSGLNSLGQLVLMSMKRPQAATRAQGVGLIVQLVGLVTLGWRFGIEGASVASLIAYLVRLAMTMRGLAPRRFGAS